MMLEFLGGFVVIAVIFFAGVWGVGLTCFAIMEWRRKRHMRAQAEIERLKGEIAQLENDLNEWRAKASIGRSN